MKIEIIDLKMSDSQKQLLDYQEYLVKVMSAVFRIPECYIERPIETRWQKVKRKVRLLKLKIKECLHSLTGGACAS